MGKRVEILCKIVDNYGDAGVCWRVARALKLLHGCDVRFWIDQPHILERLTQGKTHGIDIRQWPTPFPALEDVGDMVIEAFACGTPAPLIAAMRQTRPVWVNLEYLALEPWAETHHGLTSIHPATGLVQHYVFPGFSEKTGGLVTGDHHPKPFDWRRFGLPQERAAGELRLSLFCYKQAKLKGLLEALAANPAPVRLLVPEGVGGLKLKAGDVRQEGNLTLHGFAFIPQPDFDDLLAACDLNLVRGEDSFSRANLAGKPFLWQIYPQDEDIHLLKLKAFLDQLAPQMAPEDAKILAFAHEVWNVSGLGWQGLWPQLRDMLPRWESSMAKWSDLLKSRPCLARQLMDLFNC